jgi:hypothetical protein
MFTNPTIKILHINATTICSKALYQLQSTTVSFLFNTQHNTTQHK